MRRKVADPTRGRSELLELGAGLAAGLAVLAVSLVQWGLSEGGWARGVTLGLALGVIVSLSIRRSRAEAAERDRAAAERQLQLARELHDAVASQVSIIGIQSAAARRIISTDPAGAERALAAIEFAARTANGDLRRMLTTLRSGSPMQATPGLDHLAELVEEYRAHGLQLHLDAAELDESVPDGIGSVAYRILQEALANVLTHAGPVRTAVRVATGDGALRIRVENDPGRPAAGHRGSGLGLAGIGERVALFGGEMEAEARSDGGFVIDVRMPVSS